MAVENLKVQRKQMFQKLVKLNLTKMKLLLPKMLSLVMPLKNPPKRKQVRPESTEDEVAEVSDDDQSKARNLGEDSEEDSKESK